MTELFKKAAGHGQHRPAETAQPYAKAIDPVCGMTIAVGPSSPSFEHIGKTYYFCCNGCRECFAADPVLYLEVAHDAAIQPNPPATSTPAAAARVAVAPMRTTPCRSSRLRRV